MRLFSRMRILYFLLFCTLQLTNLFAQGGPSGSPWFHSIDVSAHYGFIWAHCPGIVHLQEKNLTLFQLSLSHQTSGSRMWHHHYHFPEIGMGILYGNFGRPDVTGHSVAFAPHISLPLFRGNAFELFIRHDLGIAYLTRKYDPILNRENNAIGSHVNISYGTRINAQIKTGNHSRLSAGIGMMHFSNGGARKPNLGINIPVIIASYAYTIAPTPDISERMVQSDRIGNLFFSLSLGGGVTRISPFNDKSFPAFSLAATISRAVSQKRNLGVGADLFLNYADQETLRIKHHREFSMPELIKSGIHLSYEQAFGGVDFIFQNGVYLKAQHREKDKLYSRIGFRYHTKQNLLLHFCLNSNRFTASFIELGMGVRLAGKE